MEQYKDNRAFMKCPDFKAVMSQGDQEKGLPQPPLEKDMSGERIELPVFDRAVVQADYTTLLDIRRSERAYADCPASQEQLAYLLWSVQGVQEIRGSKRYATFRPVPSGGARHPFEVYILVRNVEGLKPGLYHYLPLEQVGEKRSVIEFLRPIDDIAATITETLAGQGWAASASFVLYFSCLPYRGEWRYGQAAHRVMLIDAGHVGQNTMLSAAALGLGSCCVAAYDAEKCDTLLDLDGDNEFTVYAVPVGVPKGK